MSRPSLAAAARTGVGVDDVHSTVREFRADYAPDACEDERRSAMMRLVNQYYDLVTDFYEYGWGQSFHFAPRFRGESFRASIVRHEHYLASRLGLGPADRVLDVGCGVGGPMREIARFSGASVIGVNNNAYQIGKGDQHNARAGLLDRCRFVKADFAALPLDDGAMTAAYAIEATCHAADRTQVFAEVLRVLEPGSLFGGYEWCTTDRFEPSREDHRRIAHGIEEGDALPPLTPTSAVDQALRDAGFELLETRDLAGAGDRETPWYLPLTGGELTAQSIGRTIWGRRITHHAVRALERLGVAPKGSSEVSDLLNLAADALVEGGERQIFTPMYFFLARKPA